MIESEIKKALYKQNPKARLSGINKGLAQYSTVLKVKVGENTYSNEVIRFEIPLRDMGTAQFDLSMEAKHLIRWMI